VFQCDKNHTIDAKTKNQRFIKHTAFPKIK